MGIFIAWLYPNSKQETGVECWASSPRSNIDNQAGVIITDIDIIPGDETHETERAHKSQVDRENTQKKPNYCNVGRESGNGSRTEKMGNG